MLIVAFVCFFILVLAWFCAASDASQASHEPAPAPRALDHQTSTMS